MLECLGNFALVAQWIERRSPEPKAVGSIPIRRTTKGRLFVSGLFFLLQIKKSMNKLKWTIR